MLTQSRSQLSIIILRILSCTFAIWSTIMYIWSILEYLKRYDVYWVLKTCWPNYRPVVEMGGKKKKNKKASSEKRQWKITKQQKVAWINKTNPAATCLRSTAINKIKPVLVLCYIVDMVSYFMRARVRNWQPTTPVSF